MKNSYIKLNHSGKERNSSSKCSTDDRRVGNRLRNLNLRKERIELRLL